MRSALAWRGILSPYPVGEGLFCADGEKRVYSAWWLLAIDTSRLTTRAKRFNATLPENLLAAIDDYVKTHGGSRSGFLAEAAREKLRSH